MKSVAAWTVVVAAVLTAVTAVGGCHASARTAPAAEVAATVDHSRQDVAYLQNMVRHHEQAQSLTALVPGRSADTGLRVLAEQIAARQRSEIAAFQAQLLQWEEPWTGADTHIPGLTDPAVVQRLQGLHGPEFDRLWLDAMIDQQRGALALSRAETADGQNPDVIGIAGSVLAAGQGDLDRMNQMLEAR